MCVCVCFIFAHTHTYEERFYVSWQAFTVLGKLFVLLLFVGFSSFFGSGAAKAVSCFASPYQGTNGMVSTVVAFRGARFADFDFATIHSISNHPTYYQNPSFCTYTCL